MDQNPSRILEHGLWSGNAALLQLLGLCPLLAVSNTAVNALGMGLATLLALTATSTLIAAMRCFILREVRIPAFVMVIASVVTAIELSMHAFLPELHRVLGLFLPLIVTNCVILGRAEAFASRVDVGRAALDGFAVGLGFLAVLLVLGMLREWIGQGSLFAGAGLLLHAPWLETGRVHGGLLIALLPPGAFVLLGLLIALRNRLQRVRIARAELVEARA
jgi:Na+-translocating ferredoxin:NAD+ oxidoreductase subunit E